MTKAFNIKVKRSSRAFSTMSNYEDTQLEAPTPKFEEREVVTKGFFQEPLLIK
jgi:hypothetical protein